MKMGTVKKYQAAGNRKEIGAELSRLPSVT
jgi:hypothetical protein